MRSLILFSLVLLFSSCSSNEAPFASMIITVDNLNNENSAVLSVQSRGAIPFQVLRKEEQSLGEFTIQSINENILNITNGEYLYSLKKGRSYLLEQGYVYIYNKDSKPHWPKPLMPTKEINFNVSNNVDRAKKVLVITLQNISDKPISFRVAREHFECKIYVVNESLKFVYYEETFLNLLTTSFWLKKELTIPPNEKIVWTIPFDKIKPKNYLGMSFENTIKSGHVELGEIWGVHNNR